MVASSDRQHGEDLCRCALAIGKRGNQQREADVRGLPSCDRRHDAWLTVLRPLPFHLIQRGGLVAVVTAGIFGRERALGPSQATGKAHA